MLSNSLEIFRKVNRTVFVVTLLFSIEQWSKEHFSQNVVMNPGIAFSFLSSVPNDLLIVFLAVLLGVLWYFVFRPHVSSRPELYYWGQCFFFAGAISNLVDRARLGAVRDIWIIPGTNIHNNLGDYFIAFGALMLIISTSLDFSTKEKSLSKEK